QIDYSGLNKFCAKDMYPLPKEGKELASLLRYPYKYFLRLLKEYSQISMIEDNEEKTSFHTEEGVYCFTHMPKELKKLRYYTSEDDGKCLSRSKRMERGNILERNSNKKQK
nr:reverse transcriptase domain-containing protein [Tanacetum cinerariifolium]